MAVAHDAASESHTGTSGSTSEASFSWSHDPVGTPRGVLVFVITKDDADLISSVTYDGTALTQVSEAIDTAGEPARCTAFFLGASVPTTDPATIVVNRTNNATGMYAIGITVTAGDDTETQGAVLLENNGSWSEQSVNDGSTGVNSVRYAGHFNGAASVRGIGTSSTELHNIDFGVNTASAVRETTAGQGSRSVGWSAGGNDDRAAVHIAVREVFVAAGTSDVGMRGILRGVAHGVARGVG